MRRDCAEIQRKESGPAHQPQGRGQSQAALAGKRDRLELGACFVAGAGKADADLVAAKDRYLTRRRRVLLVEDFTLPAAVGRTVGAEIIEEGVAAEATAIYQQHHTGQAARDAIKRADVD